MRIRHLAAHWRGRDAALTSRRQAHPGGPGRDERDDAPWGDERQVAVWGEVSARTLYVVIVLNAAAGWIFNAIDSSRYAPCVIVFVAIALACSAYAGWAARRKGVDMRPPRGTGRAGLVPESLAFGVMFYVLNRFIAGGHIHDWPAVAVTIVCAGVACGIAVEFRAAWQRRVASSTGAGLRLPRTVADGAGLVAGSLAYGVVIYVIARVTAGGHNHDNWWTAAVTIASYAVGWGIGARFVAAWAHRQALGSQEATDDDTLRQVQ